MSEQLVLDVGCGRRPRGNVNVDIGQNGVRYEHEKGVPFNYKTIPNFVQAHACYLPFKDNTFSRVESFSVIEHVKTDPYGHDGLKQSPFKVLQEIVRVAQNHAEVMFYVPHRLSQGISMRKAKPEHVSFFTRGWFNKAFKRLGITTFDCHIFWKELPHQWLPLFKIPAGIRMKFWVVK